MNLLILNDRHIYKKNKDYYSDETFSKFIWFFKKYYHKINVCVPIFKITNNEKPIYYKIPIDKDKIIETEKTYPYKSVKEYYLKILIILIFNIPILIKAIKKSDAVFMRIPAMNSFLTTFLCLIFKKPIISYFVGDENEIIKTGTKYRGMNRKIALIISKFHNILYRKICRYSKVVFFISSELKKKYENYSDISYFIFTSLVETKDIHFKKDICDDIKPTKLLYVGGLRHEKGVEYLIRSIKYLIQEGFQIRLQICGIGPENMKLQTITNEMKINTFIDFLGFVPFGPKLSEIYNQNDIFILPSISDGVPKVLLEAMAEGLPIIATKVGGIPDIITDRENGILTAPASPYEIVKAIKLIIKDDTMRNRIRRNGYKFVANHTIDKQVMKIVNIINNHIR